MDVLPPAEGIATCVKRSHKHWATVEQVELEEVAVVILNDDDLRTLPTWEAAAPWQSPITPLF